ncbi:MAG: 50S ribosomal protein L2 [Microgenomates bacterium OLB22]|nr:MAG: 50S ribosomal protein L2 [Microgenomates bacterium OLB22]
MKSSVVPKSLKKILKKRSGRDNSGSISIRHQGGRHKRFYRVIDWKRDKKDISATIIDIQYDPNRTSPIALLEYADGEKRYIIVPEGLAVGDVVMSSTQADIRPGNAMPIKNIPLGTEIHNIELYSGQGGQMVKSAGSSAVVSAKDGDYVDIRMPSREIRRVLGDCYATIGRIANSQHKLTHLGKAGRKRWLGIRPSVRGVAQNPKSHPHGGGEGRSGTGSHPKTPWGKPAMGKKTRRPKWSDKFIIKTKRQGRS